MSDDNCKNRISRTGSTWMVAGVLFVVAAIVAAVSSRATAIVAPQQVTQRNSAGEVIASFLQGKRSDVADLTVSFSNTDDLLGRCAADAAPLQLPLGAIRNDPFRFNSTHAESADSGTGEKADSDRIAMLQELGKLQLQSICGTGDHPACMIDNRLCHEGEQITCFTIERIGDTAVVIRNGEYRFELKIAG